MLVLHDLNLAARYADHLVAMARSRSGLGPPAEVLTEALMREVFDLDCKVITDPTSGAPLVLPIGRTRPHGAAATPSPVPGEIAS